MKVSLKTALLGLVLLVAIVGLVPAAVLLDHRLVEGLEEGVRDDVLGILDITQQKAQAISAA